MRSHLPGRCSGCLLLVWLCMMTRGDFFLASGGRELGGRAAPFRSRGVRAVPGRAVDGRAGPRRVGDGCSGTGLAGDSHAVPRRAGVQ